MNTPDVRKISEESLHSGQLRNISSRRTGKKITYPDSDGKPMADNTKQFEWIVKIKENLEQIFADSPDVFVAGDLLWYPEEGNNKLRIAPDAMVVFGRPKGHRGSYRTWEEDGIAPQVVFEVLSPGNRPKEMRKKLGFYESYGVSEYYMYDPDRIRLNGWLRRNSLLSPVENMQGWISPLLKIRFEIKEDDLYIFGPDGGRFLSPLELRRLFDSEQEKSEAERRKALLAEQNAEAQRRKTLLAEQNAEAQRRKALLAEQNAEAQRRKTLLAEQNAEAQRLRAERLAARLRELGIEAE